MDSGKPELDPGGDDHVTNPSSEHTDAGTVSDADSSSGDAGSSGNVTESMIDVQSTSEGKDAGHDGDANDRDANVSAANDREPEANAQADETCWLEYLGDWVRCEASADSLYQLSVEANSAQDCVDACMNDPGCVAVTDYYWRGWDDCYLLLGGCDEPSTDVWPRGDGAREYRKVCGDQRPEAGLTELSGPESFEPGCTFRSLMPGEGCNESAEPDTGVVGADSLDACFELCAAREDCGAVSYWLEPGDTLPFECILHLAACTEPTMVEIEDPADSVYYFKKDCSAGQDAGGVH